MIDAADALRMTAPNDLRQIGFGIYGIFLATSQYPMLSARMIAAVAQI